MSEKQRHKALQKLRPYVREVADRMKLRDWRITLEDELLTDGSLAMACLVYGRNKARIHLSKKFFTDTPEGQRETICHELTHCLFAPMDNALRKSLEGIALELYEETFERGIEEAGNLIALSMPLPPK